MAKILIAAKCLETGERRVFENQVEAGEYVGVSASAVSYACTGTNQCNGWFFRRVERVFMVHLKFHGLWVVAVSGPRDSGYVERGNPNRKISPQEISEVMDVTEMWYFNDKKGEEGRLLH